MFSALSAQKREWNIEALQASCHRKACFIVQLYIQQGGIDGFLVQRGKGSANRRAGTDNIVASLAED